MPRHGCVKGAPSAVALLLLLTACLGRREDAASLRAEPYSDAKWYECPVGHKTRLVGESVSCIGEFSYSVPGSLESRGLTKEYRCPEGFALVSAPGGLRFKCVDYDEAASRRRDPGCFLLGTMDSAKGPEEIGTGHTLKVDERGDRDLCRLPSFTLISKLPDFMGPRCREGERLLVRGGSDHCTVPHFLNRRQVAPAVPLPN